jgi:angio-associated migratory cell protein
LFVIHAVTFNFRKLLEEPMEEVDETETILPERDDSILTFTKHIDSLFCGSFNPDATLAVTGGEDDKAYVWKVEDGEVVFEVKEHTDSVIAAEFSYDGTFLATGDMAGEVKVFKIEKNYKKVWEFSMGDMSWMKWHRKANVLLAGSEVGEIYIWRIPSGDCKVLQGSGDKCEVAVFTSDDKKLAAGYGDGTFKLWDVKNQQVLLNIPPEEREAVNSEDAVPPPAITTIDVDNENQVIIAGSVDGTAKLIGNNGLIGVLRVGSTSSQIYPIEKVLIDCPGFELKVAVTGSLSGQVIIWDVAKQSIRNECQDDDPTGITTIRWAKDHTILAGTLGGAIKAWNMRSGELKFKLLGHADNIHDVAYNEKKNLLLTVSEDQTAKIFNLPM